jgi:hypothetical protein
MLPLPRFVLHPLTAMAIAVTPRLSGRRSCGVTHIWKGTGALFGAYVFAALASRRAAKPLRRTIVKECDVENSDRVSVPGQVPVATNFSQK